MSFIDQMLEEIDLKRAEEKLELDRLKADQLLAVLEKLETLPAARCDLIRARCSGGPSQNASSPSKTLPITCPGSSGLPGAP